MKYKIWYSLATLVLLFASCTAIEDRAAMGPVLAASQVKIQIVQKTTGANAVTVLDATPGAIIYFDWGTGTGKSAAADDSVNFYVPFAGTFKLKYTAFCAGGTVTDSTTFTIAANDEAYFDRDPVWKTLTGGGSGETWVFGTDVPGGIVGGNGPINSPAPAWWTLNASSSGIGSQLSSPWSVQDQITCNLIGAANFSVKHSDGSVTKGFFNVATPVIDSGDGDPTPYHAITVSNGAHFPWPSGNGIGQYHFTVLTAKHLCVHDYNGYNCALYKQMGTTW
ncbi:MAG: hypothetical protein P4L34_11675 [Paludibacter sp.]|nr:hypothetical protein [Paludibacter sp.]